MRAICSTAAVSRRTGRRPLRATAQPATPAAITPASPKSEHHQAELVAARCSWDSSDWASTSACAVAAVGTATTR